VGLRIARGVAWLLLLRVPLRVAMARATRQRLLLLLNVATGCRYVVIRKVRRLAIPRKVKVSLSSRVLSRGLRKALILGLPVGAHGLRVCGIDGLCHRLGVNRLTWVHLWARGGERRSSKKKNLKTVLCSPCEFGSILRLTAWTN